MCNLLRTSGTEKLVGICEVLFEHNIGTYSKEQEELLGDVWKVIGEMMSEEQLTQGLTQILIPSERIPAYHILWERGEK